MNTMRACWKAGDAYAKCMYIALIMYPVLAYSAWIAIIVTSSWSIFWAYAAYNTLTYIYKDDLVGCISSNDKMIAHASANVDSLTPVERLMLM